ncbi:phage tail tape measure protein [Sphingopyxis yananensis]|uniref:phage tail tape measure protein n=1 Tax=Sphingopyxis yananensis TaxID=2886687 RepID=UPI001D0FD9C8|nr:phage tail tape measure protein [Sphingopyxis yananensis]MCC2602737.1 phage tail tape measure protein [Sphingopyxis yananensis]
MSKDLLLRVMIGARDQLSGPLRNIVGLGQSASQQQAALNREARDANRELATQQQRIRRAMQEGGRLDVLVARERELRDRVEETNRRLRERERLNNINARADAMQSAGADLRSSGTGNMLAAGAMAAPLVYAAKSAISLESAMADVRKVVDFESPAAFQQMSDDLVDLSMKIPMSAEGLAQIVAEAGRAGVARADLLTFAEDAAKMGVAFDTTAEEAGAMMAKWRTAFGMGQEDVRGLSDKINALTNTYGGNVAGVSGIVTRIGALGGVSGVAADEIAAMGQVMSAVGVEEEVAATGIKNFMLAMTKGEKATKAQKQAFAELGLDSTKVAEAMHKDAGGAIDDILRRIAKLPKAQRTAQLTALFGSESVSAISPMLSNLEQLQKNFALIGDESQYAGSMNKEFLAAINKTEGALGLAKNAFTAVNIELGNMLLPLITEGSRRFVEIAGSVRSWIKENPELSNGLMMIYGAAIGLVAGIGALKLGLGLLLGPFGSVFRLVMTNGPMLVSAFTMIKGAAMAVAGALSWPIIAGIALAAGIAYLAYQAYTHWDSISAAFMTGVAKVKSLLSGLPDWLKNLGSMAMQGLLLMISPTALASRLTEVAKRGVTAFKNYFGIKSPSRLMMGMGGYLTEGLARGIDGGSGSPVAAAQRMAANVGGASMVHGGFAPAGGGMGRGMGSGGLGPVTIHVHGAPGQSAEEIARLVDLKLREREAQASAARRSSFKDD